MCIKVVNTCFLLFDSVTDRYTTQETCDKAVDDCLTALKFIPDWCVTSKMFENFHDALNVNYYIHFLNEHFSKVTIFSNQMEISGGDLDKINLYDDNKFYEDYPDSIIQFRLLAWRNKFEKRKALKN